MSSKINKLLYAFFAIPTFYMYTYLCKKQLQQLITSILFILKQWTTTNGSFSPMFHVFS